MPENTVPSYCVFDGIHWNSHRGLARFSAQLKKHLHKACWRPLRYSPPRWKSLPGRLLISEFHEPICRERLQPDVSFYPHNILPLLQFTHRSLRVLVLHDVLFLRADGRQSLGNRYRSAKLQRSLSQADLIITVSEVSRAEIIKLLSKDTQVLVIPNALADAFVEAQPLAEPRISKTTKVLHFGGHAPTKNTQAVFQAVAQLRRGGSDVHLVLAAMGGQSNLVEEWRLQSQLPAEALTVLPSLSDGGLLKVFAESDIHCMPSTGEGFGIPVIEAARCGVTNILSPLPVFRELIGNHAIFTSSFEASGIADAVLQYLNGDFSAMIKSARARTDRYLFENVHALNALPALQVIAGMINR